MMSWKVYKDNNNIINIVYDGNIIHQDVLEATEECANLFNVDETNMYLVEFGHITVDLGIKDIIGMPELWRDIGFRREDKLAIISSSKSAVYNHARFFVLMTRVRGWRVHRFDVREEAISWLLEQD